MKKAILEFKNTGECPIDIKIAVKRWNLLCRIYKHNDNYTLVERTPKGKRKLNVSISKKDAEQLMDELNLTGIQDQVFKNYKTYLYVG
ncbi:MAG: hypothetical protein SFH39_00290 [Candidatus Magnetobacterium sp. LHC-1]